MKRNLFILTVCAALCGSNAWADTTTPAKETPDMMKMMEKAGAPTDIHKVLEKRVGNWTTTAKMWMKPGEKPTESTGKAEIKSIFGGRFIQENYEGEFMGKPFNGMGLLGYDTMKNKFVSNWADNMMTGIMTMEGTSDNKGKTITSEGTMMCPMTGKPKTFRSVSYMKWNGKLVYENYEKDDTGKEFKSMEIVYTRNK